MAMLDELRSISFLSQFVCNRSNGYTSTHASLAPVHGWRGASPRVIRSRRWRVACAAPRALARATYAFKGNVVMPDYTFGQGIIQQSRHTDLSGSGWGAECWVEKKKRKDSITKYSKSNRRQNIPSATSREWRQGLAKAISKTKLKLS